MKLPRDIDGIKLARHLVKHWEYEFVRQSGSHMRLRTQTPHEHTVTIPAHKPLKTGTFAGIVQEVSAHKRVTAEELLRYL